MITPLLALFACATPGGSGLRSQAPDGFWDTWGDGQAELDGYQLVQPRYAALHPGEETLIFVTETFTAAQRVKSDGGHDDEFPVLKLNAARDFVTGIYDYNTMTSVFAPLDGRLPLGQPTKISSSVQEWCGHMWDQLLIDPRRFQRASYSYFDGEGDQRVGARLPEGAVFADALPLLVRGLLGEWVPEGGQTEVPMAERLIDLRMGHRPLAFTPADVRRDPGPHPVEVPAGAFTVERWTVTHQGQTLTLDVEKAPPHRLVRWSSTTGEEGALTGTLRTRYWEQNQPGFKHLRAELGLPSALQAPAAEAPAAEAPAAEAPAAEAPTPAPTAPPAPGP